MSFKTEEGPTDIERSDERPTTTGGKEIEILEKQDTQVEDASFEATLQFGIVPKNYGEIA